MLSRFQFATRSRLCVRGVFGAAVAAGMISNAAAGCFSTPTGVVGWWPGDGDANDLVSTNHGTLLGGATASAVGVNGNAFHFDGTNSYVQIADAAALKPANLTVEAWVRFTGLDSAGTGAAPGVQYVVFKQNSRSGNFVGFDLGKTRVGTNDFFKFVIGSAAGVFVPLQSSTVISTGVWYHVAGVRGSNFTQLYVNGVLEQQTNVTFAQDYGSQPLCFGTSGQAYWDRRFKGDLDELSLYNRALASNEIAAVFAAGAAGKCKAPNLTLQPQPQTVLVGNNATFTAAASGIGALRFQWRLNGANLSSATNTSLTLTNCQLADQGNYSVTVSNALGWQVSADAWLQVNGPVAGVPYVVSVTPAIAGPGTNVTISGFNFSPVLASNLVYFGATRASVVNASSNSLTVIVPVGATFGPVSVNVNGRVGLSPLPFLPTFVGDTTPVGATTLAAGQNLAAPNGPHRTAIADLDGDGWPDLAVASVYAHTISLFRNLGSGTALAPASFAPRVDFPSLGGSTDNPYGLIAAEVDGDGKLDLVFADRVTNRVGVYRNVDNAGTLDTNSFAAPVYFNTGADPRYVRVADLDGDGRPDIVTCNTVDGTVSILRNVGSAGTLDAGSFAPHVDLAAGAGAYDVAIQDLDGDGRPDLAVANPNGSTVSLFRNVSVPGTLDATSFAPRVDLPANGDATIAAGDLDGDGKPELISGGISTAMSVFRNTSTIGSLTTNSFAAKVDYGNPGWVHNLVLGDVNGDGKAEVVVVGELGSYLRVYQNQSAPGAVALAGGVDFATGWNAWGVSVGDLDGDRRSDIVFCNAYDNTVTLYRNAQPFGGPPFITTQPASQAVAIGNNATLSVVAGGQSPLSYQWRLNGTNLPGATNALLLLMEAQFAQSGDYSVRITNALGAITSVVAAVSVVTPSCAPPAAGLVGWWSGNGTPLDSVSTNHGSLVGGAGYGNGRVGPAFLFGGASDGVLVGNPASLQLQDFTIETWMKRSDPAVAAYGVEGTALLLGYGYGGYGFGLFNDGRLFLTRVGIDNVTLNAPGIADTNYHHVAVTKSGSAVVFFVDGVAYPVPAYSTTYSFGTSAAIGLRSDTSNASFLGLVDEVAVFNRALSAGEVQTLYNSGSAGKCPLRPAFAQSPSSTNLPVGSDLILAALGVGSPNLGYQWYFNQTPLTNSARLLGATNSTLVISNVQVADAGNYLLTLTSPYGVATSAVAVVQIGLPPAVLLQPTNQTGVVGGSVLFAAAVGGNEPLTYRWYQNTTALTDDARHLGPATTNLVITNLAVADAGNYTLRVTNAFGSVTSAVATLTVLTPPSITTQPRGYSVPVGLPASLSGTATGSAPLRYQWLLNGNPVPNATNFGVTISNLALADFGNYQLVVTNGGGAVTSAVASVTVGPVGIWGYYSQAASAPIWPAAGLSNVASVVAGNAVSLALRQDGTVYAWGFNNPATNVPVGLSGVVAIAAGQSHALALLSNGTVRAWGLGTSGQTNVPASLSNVIAVAAGTAHSAALRSDGTVVAWGGTSTEQQTNIPPGLMKIVAIDAGGSQTLALREDGRLFGWGGRTQYPVPYDLKGVTGFSAGPALSALNLALTSNGLVRAWGGVGTATNVPAGLSGIIAVEGAGGSDQSTGVSLAVRSNRTVTGWGGVVGALSLTNIPNGLSNVLAVAGGLGHVVALVDNGRPLIVRPPVGGTFYSGRDLVLKAKTTGNAPLSFQWFKDGNPIVGGTTETLVFPFAQSSDAGSYHLVASNALGVALSVAVPVNVVNQAPVLMSQPQSRFAYYGSPFSVGASVIGSGSMEFLWLQNGVLAYAGTNDLVFDRAQPQHGGSYQLIASNPFGSVTSTVAQIKFSRVASWGGESLLTGPALTNLPAGTDLGSVLAVASGYFHALAINSNRTIVAWGTTANGATNVPTDLSNVVAVAAGDYFSVALKSDGTVVAWGLGSSGQTNVPAGLSNVRAIAAGDRHALALRADGTVAGWGLSGPASVPAGLSNVVAIAAGSVHSLALKTDGTIVGWGGYGKMPSYTNAVAISAGYGQSLILQADGTVLGWSTGSGGTGLPAGGISNAVAISMGGGWQGFWHGAALRADGTVIMWGNNNVGQLNVPPELTSAIALSAGGSSTLAYLNDRSPAVATPLPDRHAASGRNVTFAALTVGQPALNYQWRWHGMDIPGAVGSTLTLTNVSRDSRGLYSALVWNALGSTNSREAWLDVVGPVKLLTSPTAVVPGTVGFVATDATSTSLAAADTAWLEVQTSTNLVNWQALSNSLVFTNGALFLQDPAQSNYPARFYRLIER